MIKLPICHAIDGNYFMHKAVHVFKPMNAPDGTLTHLVHGFFMMMFKHIKPGQPVFLVFDGSRGKEYRRKWDKWYKSNRDGPLTKAEKKIKDDMHRQMLEVKKLAAYIGWYVIHEDDFEADDVLAVLARKLSVKYRVVVHTNDKDLHSLVTKNVRVLNQQQIYMTPRLVKEKFGVSPSDIPLYLALMGDNADAIPGLANVGPKTSAKWINEYKTLKNIIRHVPKVKAEASRMRLNVKLTTLHDVVLKPLNSYRNKADPKRSNSYCAKYGLRLVGNLIKHRVRQVQSKNT